MRPGEDRIDDTRASLSATIRILLGLLCVAGCELDEGSAGLRSIRPAGIDARLRFLSSDHLQGRGAGTEGGAIAARYIASQFAAIGLEPPARDQDYLQRVPLTAAIPSSRLSFRAPGGAALNPIPGDDYVVWMTTPVDSLTIGGELVFAGRGLSGLPDGRDGFEGIDVSGDVLLLLTGEPEAMYGPNTALMQSDVLREGLARAWRSGAAGVLFVHLASEMGYGWETLRASAAGERLYLDGRGGEAARLIGWLSGESAREIAGMAGLDFATLLTSGKTASFRPIATGVSVTGFVANRSGRRSASNVVGVLHGRDRTRAEEVVVITAHYDALGVGPAADGDSIYNGAYDNASGTALLLNVAEAFTRLPRRPARSIVFLATTASEAGLLGTSHYLRRPFYPLSRTVAVLNLDGVNLWGPTRDVLLIDAGRTDLESFAGPAARAEGLRLAEAAGRPISSLYASDHLAFLQAGVPAALVTHGLDFVGWMPGTGEEVLTEYIAERYHRPRDEYRNDIEYGGAVQQGRFVLRLGVALANSERLPADLDAGEM